MADEEARHELDTDRQPGENRNGMRGVYTQEAEAGAPEHRVIERGGTFESMKFHDYRYFWAGALVSNTGSWMQAVALGALVFRITGSSTGVGLINFLAGVPTLFLAVFAGEVADRYNRRLLLIVVQVLLTIQALVIGLMAQFKYDSFFALGVVVLLGGLVVTFNMPAWMAMVPDLVPRKSLLNAIALNAAQFNSARMLGPMIAAFVFARYGIEDVFYLNAVSFLFVIWALFVIRPKQEPHVATGESAWKRVTAGFKYAREHLPVAMLLVTTATLTIFGMPYMTLMPAIAHLTLNVGDRGYSFLMAASGLGSLVGALVVASLPPTIKRSTLIRWALFAMAALLLIFSAVRNFYLALVVVAFAGAAFLIANSAINTSIQMAVPPRIRARVMALFVISFMGMMPIGSLVFGALGDAITAPGSVAAAAVVLLLYSLVLLARPALVRVLPAPEHGGPRR